MLSFNTFFTKVKQRKKQNMGYSSDLLGYFLPLDGRKKTAPEVKTRILYALPYLSLVCRKKKNLFYPPSSSVCSVRRWRTPPESIITKATNGADSSWSKAESSVEAFSIDRGIKTRQWCTSHTLSTV